MITNLSFIYYLFNSVSGSTLMDEILRGLKSNILVLVAHVITYTECTRRNLPYFRKTCLISIYIDITKHTYIRVQRGLLAVPRTVPV